MTRTPPAMTPSQEMAQLRIVKGLDSELTCGGLRIVACTREVGEIDGGISVYVFSALASDDGELLRFDLFRARPHYHAPAENRAETKIEPSAGAGARDWGIDAITHRMGELLGQAGFDDIAAQLDHATLASAGPSIRSLFDGLAEPSEVSYFEVPRSVLDGLAAS